jgi:hypothetical protein
MQTLRLKFIQQQNSRLDRLLHAFTTSRAGLSDEAYMVRDWAALPVLTREHISRAERTGRSWECWVDGERTWLFIAEMAMEPSRERGNPVLKISRHAEDGQLHDCGQWVSDKEQRWRRLGD